MMLQLDFPINNKLLQELKKGNRSTEAVKINQAIKLHQRRIKDRNEA
jgi:hypothetical protein